MTTLLSVCSLLVAFVPSSYMSVGDSDVHSSWGFVCFFCRFLCRFVCRFLGRFVCLFLGRFFCLSVASFFSSCLVCRLVFSFFYYFLGLLSRRFCCHLLGRLFGRILIVSSVSFVFLCFSSFSFFILSSLLATPVSLSFSIFLSSAQFLR